MNEEWGEWIEWKGGAWPTGRAQVRYRCGHERVTNDAHKLGRDWDNDNSPDDIVAYRVRKPAEHDWKADMLAAWEAGELEFLFNASSGYPGTWVAQHERPEFSFEQSRYRRRPKPAEPAAVPQPKSDLPGIAEYQKWKAAQPAPAPIPQPEPKRCDGLGVMAPMSGRVGGKWGL